MANWAFNTLPLKEITIEAEDGLIRFHTIEMRSPEIKVSPLDKIAPEIPLNADYIQIIVSSFKQEIKYDRLKTSAIWKVLKEHMEQLRHQLMRATSDLYEYGVKMEDLAELVAQKLGIVDRDSFFKILFTKD